MKFGDSVVYIEREKEYTATVLDSRILDDHMGANDEPLLTLGFFQEVTIPNPSGKGTIVKKVVGTSHQLDLVQIRHDVAHESHEYSEEQQKKYGVQVFSGGRWKEIESSTFTGRVEEGEETKKKKKKSEVN